MSAPDLTQNLSASERGRSWLSYMSNDTLAGLRKVSNMLQPCWTRGNCYPPAEMVMQPFHVIAPEETKMIIVCKEPYTGNMATGIPVEPNADITPDTAKYFMDLISDYWLCVDRDNFMRCYYLSGILVMNASFTSQRSDDKRYSLSNSHFPLWAEFVKPLMRSLVADRYPILALGAEARSTLRNIENADLVEYASFPRDDATYRDFSVVCSSMMDKYIYDRSSRLS